jgi:hypothetical protein
MDIELDEYFEDGSADQYKETLIEKMQKICDDLALGFHNAFLTQRTEFLFEGSTTVNSLEEFLMKECSTKFPEYSLRNTVEQIVVLFNYLRYTLFVYFGTPHDFHTAEYGDFFYRGCRTKYKETNEKLFEKSTFLHKNNLDGLIHDLEIYIRESKGLLTTQALVKLWAKMQDFIYDFIYTKYGIVIPKKLSYEVVRKSKESDNRIEDLKQMCPNYKFDTNKVAYVDCCPKEILRQLNLNGVKVINPTDTLGMVDAASRESDPLYYTDDYHADLKDESIDIGEFNFSYNKTGDSQHPIIVKKGDKIFMRIQAGVSVTKVANLVGCDGRSECLDIISCKISSVYNHTDQHVGKRVKYEATNFTLLDSKTYDSLSAQIQSDITHALVAAKGIGDQVGIEFILKLKNLTKSKHLTKSKQYFIVTGDYLACAGATGTTVLLNLPDGKTRFLVDPYELENPENVIYHRFLTLYDYSFSDKFNEFKRSLENMITTELRQEVGEGLSHMISTLIEKYKDRIKRHIQTLRQLKEIETQLKQTKEYLKQKKDSDEDYHELDKRYKTQLEVFRQKLNKEVPSINFTVEELDCLFFGEIDIEEDCIGYNERFERVTLNPASRKPTKTKIDICSLKPLPEIVKELCKTSVEFYYDGSFIHEQGNTGPIQKGDKSIVYYTDEKGRTTLVNIPIDETNIELFALEGNESETMPPTYNVYNILTPISIVCGIPSFVNTKLNEKNMPVSPPENVYDNSLREFNLLNIFQSIYSFDASLFSPRIDNVSIRQGRTATAALALQKNEKETMYKYVLHSLFILIKICFKDLEEIYYGDIIIDYLIEFLTKNFERENVYIVIIPYLIDILQNIRDGQQNSSPIPFPYSSKLNLTKNKTRLLQKLQLKYNDYIILAKINRIYQHSLRPEAITVELYNTTSVVWTTITKTTETLFPRTKLQGFGFFKPKCSGHVQQKLNDLINHLKKLKKGGKLYNITKKYKNIPNNKTSKYKHPVRRTRRVRPKIPSIIRSHRRTNKIPFAKV